MYRYLDLRDALLIVRKHRRISPDFDSWQEFESLLQSLDIDLSRLEPLSKQAFQEWSPMQKIVRLQRQLRLAHEASEIDRAASFLDFLPEDQWIHLPPEEDQIHDPLRGKP